MHGQTQIKFCTFYLWTLFFKWKENGLRHILCASPLTSLPLCSLANRDNLIALMNTKALRKKLDYFSPF
jgi:hypothetical protein